MRKKTGIEQLQKRNKKKLNGLDKYCIFSFTCLIVFTIVVTVYQFKADIEFSPTLITCFYSCFGGELLLCAMLKRLKLKSSNDNSSDQFNV